VYFFKWYEMPFCRKSIERKLGFWIPASAGLAWTYGEYMKKKDQAKIIEKLPPKFYVRAYLVILSLTTIYTFAESLLTD